MLTRRNFMTTSAATVPAALADPSSANMRPRLPLRAEPRVRILSARPSEDGRLMLLADGPQRPQKLIRAEALEREFGPGTDLVLRQPDHWRMIEEGWFEGDDVYQPADSSDDAWLIWQSYYRPEVEAHDLLYDVFHDRISGPFGARIPELALELGEHPCTPRYATAKVIDEAFLPRLKQELFSRTRWLTVDECLLAEGEG